MSLNTNTLHTLCLTYNHESFIKDTLNGFAIQQTTFPVVYVIIDDASTDHTVDVLNNFLKEHFILNDPTFGFDKETDYGHVTFARHKNNTNCLFAVIRLKENHYRIAKSKYQYYKDWVNTKYVALCEGDDYWTDPLKLQKQVDFLEANEDFSICFHEAKVFNQAEGKFIEDVIRCVPSETDIMELARGNYIHTLTVVYRNNPLVINDMSKITGIITMDYVLHMLNAKYGKIKKLPDCMAVYRMNNGSVWGTKEEAYRLPLWNEMLIKIMPFFDEKVQSILHEQYLQNCKDLFLLGGEKVRSSLAYRLGYSILHPFKKLGPHKS